MDNMNWWYEKKLSKTDVEKKLSVPSRWVGEGRLLPALAAGPIKMQDEHDGEKMYNFMLIVRPLPQDGSKYYAKLEFKGSEWLAYVKENGLEPGDTVYVKEPVTHLVPSSCWVPPPCKINVFEKHLEGLGVKDYSSLL